MKIPLLPNNVGKKSVNDSGLTVGSKHIQYPVLTIGSIYSSKVEIKISEIDSSYHISSYSKHLKEALSLFATICSQQGSLN